MALRQTGRPSVVICMWRDLMHPEGGGSELYVETVAKQLAASGSSVTIHCASVAGRPADETVDGVRYLRAGGKLTVYLRSAWRLWRHRARTDVVLDVQNGLPFLSRLVTRRPVAVLLHHVHREQWPIVCGPLVSKIGWLLESRFAPRLYRHCRYVTVSECTRRELGDLGIDPRRIAVAYNGTPVPVPTAQPRSETPRVVVLGRLVPHKRVEIAIRAAAALREQIEGIEVDIVGEGWWHGELVALAGRLGVADIVHFHGFVDEQTKAAVLRRAWLGVVPSVKEGWGLSVVEAGSHGTATVAFAHAGGLSESIVHGMTGVLVDGDEDDFVATVGALLADRNRCAELGGAAREHAAAFSWQATAATIRDVLFDAPTTQPVPISSVR